MEQFPAAEIAEWGAYYGLEPFGQDRDNLHSAMIAAVVANAFRGKNSQPKTPKDFMYQDEKTAAEEQVAAFFERMDRMKQDGKVG